MTVYCWGKPRAFPALPPPSERHFDIEPRTRVLAHCHWQRDAAAHPALLALHGLEGSSTAHYMRGIADKAYARGFNVILLNQRNCGGTEALCDGLYHSGLTADAAHVIAEISPRRHRPRRRRRLFAWRQPRAEARRRLRQRRSAAAQGGLRGITGDGTRRVRARARTPRELHLSMELRARTEGPHAAQGGGASRPIPDRAAAPKSGPSGSSTRSSPLRISAFKGADDYYYRASAMRVIDRIRVPGAHHHRRGRSVRARSSRSDDPRFAANPHINVDRHEAWRALRVRSTQATWRG